MKKNYDEIYTQFTHTYKSREDYEPRHEFPIFSLHNASDLVKNKNIFRLKAFLIHSSTQNLFIELLKCWDGKQVQRNALDLAVLQLTQHGECGVQTGGLIWSLLEHGAPEVFRGEFPNGLHAFVVVPPAKKGQSAIVYDPYFKLSCPLDKYLENEQVLKFGRAVLSNPKWKLTDKELIITSYTREMYRNTKVLIENQLSQLIAMQKVDSVSRWIELLNYSVSLDEHNFSEQQMISNLRLAFSKSLLEKDTNEVLINEMLNRYLPIPKINKPTFFIPSPQDELVAKYEAIIKILGRGNSLMPMLKQKEYGSVLRTACNDKHGYEFVNVLLEYKDKIALDINEYSKSNKTAIDYAVKHEDKKIYDLLIQHGAIIQTSNII